MKHNNFFYRVTTNLKTDITTFLIMYMKLPNNRIGLDLNYMMHHIMSHKNRQNFQLIVRAKVFQFQRFLTFILMGANETILTVDKTNKLRISFSTKCYFNQLTTMSNNVSRFHTTKRHLKYTTISSDTLMENGFGTGANS
jgi:hypothetical protein